MSAAPRLMPLDARHRAAFDFIARAIEGGFAPTFDDIRMGLDLASRGSAQKRVNTLIGLGWLARSKPGKLVLSAAARTRRAGKAAA